MLTIIYRDNNLVFGQKLPARDVELFSDVLSLFNRVGETEVKLKWTKKELAGEAYEDYVSKVLGEDDETMSVTLWRPGELLRVVWDEGGSMLLENANDCFLGVIKVKLESMLAPK